MNKKNSRNERPRDIKTRIYYFLVFISSLNLSLKKLKKIYFMGKQQRYR